MRVIAVGLDPSESQPVLLLQEAAHQRRVLPVWVGLPEATAIEFARRHVTAPRPTTHELIGHVIDAGGRRLVGVCITELRGSVFHAELVLDGDTTVSARVSDAVALALHLDVPIQAEDGVLDVAGLAEANLVETSEGADDEIDEPVGEPVDDRADEVERFRRFLDSATPEDFRGS
jgi:bifunctional DNase/RNase